MKKHWYFQQNKNDFKFKHDIGKNISNWEICSIRYYPAITGVYTQRNENIHRAGIIIN